jgi:hypothetical protein
MLSRFLQRLEDKRLARQWRQREGRRPTAADVARMQAARDAGLLPTRRVIRHQASEIGNMMGGYDCTCGEPWLTDHCMSEPRASTE